ncbi:MAG: hypothetical protein ACM3RP_06010 [Chitinophagales bacterium]
MKLFESYAGLPTAIYALFAGSVVNNLGNFVAPFLALFLSDKFSMQPDRRARQAAAPSGLCGGDPGI